MKFKYLLLWFIILKLNMHFLQAQQWEPVSSGINGIGVREMYSFNGNLYLGGTFDSAGSVACNNIAQWNNNTFAPLGSGVSHNGGAAIISFTDFNGNLIVGGTFDSAGSIAASQIAIWNGSNWSAFAQTTIGSVNSLANYNGELWNGSDIDTSNGSGYYVHPVQWNGTQWSCKGKASGTVSAMLNYNGDLYLGGAFTVFLIPSWLGVNRIVKWDGVNWTTLDAGFNKGVYCLAEHNGELYAGGLFDSSGTQNVNHIAKWSGNSWQPVGGGMNGSVTSMVSYNNELYAAGHFGTAGSVAATYIAKWNGVNWTPVDSGFNNSVLALAVYDNELYAGGWFTMSGNTPVSHIAKLDTSTLTTSINHLNSFDNLTIYPNPFSSNISISYQKQASDLRIFTIRNIYGQIIFRKQENNLNKNLIVDLSILSKGVYFLEVILDGERVVKKIVKE